MQPHGPRPVGCFSALLAEAGAILTEKGTSFYSIQELDDFANDVLINLPKVGGRNRSPLPE
jgi:hypothetical protein